MNTKILTLSLFTVFALFLSVGLASAATLAEWDFEDQTLDPSTDITGGATLSVNTNATETYSTGNDPSPDYALSSTNWDTDDNFEITLATTDYENLILKFDERASATGPTEFKIQYSSDGTTFNDLSGSTTSTSSSFSANPMHTFDFSSITSIDDDTSITLRIIVTSDANSSSGTWRIDNLKIEGTLIQTEPEGIGDFCEWDDGIDENPGELGVQIKDITVSEGFGDDDEWLPFDEIEIEIEIENNGDDDIDDISLEWGLYNEDTEEWTIEVDEEDEYNIKDGDDETVTITFTIDDDMDEDLEDLEDGRHYVLYVRGTGEVDNKDNDDTCDWDSEQVELIIEKDIVILTDFDHPATTSCGTEVTIEARVWNIGSKDQDDVSVRIFNKDLEIDKIVEIGDIDSFDKEDLDVTVKIPEDAKEKTYIFVLETIDEDDDVYESDYDDELAVFRIPIDVQGSCGVAPGEEGDALVSAVLESGGKPGEQLVIRATLTNTGDTTATYTLNSAGHGEWADSVDISPTTLTLASGDSDDILFTFDVKSDAEGDKLFTIEVISENQLVVDQPVSVTIEKPTTDLSGVFGENWYLWLIGLLNIILVIIIIIVAVRVAKR